jgi:titin
VYFAKLFNFTVEVTDRAGDQATANLAITIEPRTLGAPKGPLTAVPFGSGAAKVTWHAPATNGAAITAYVVTPYLGNVAQAAKVFDSAATSATVTGLNNGKSYRFTIAARDALGTGATSSKTAAITVGSPGQPHKPSVSRIGSGHLKVAFSAPANNGAPITSFKAVCRSSNGGTSEGKTGTASPLGVKTLTLGKKYTCTVTATNSRGTGPESPPSTSVTA